MTTWALAYQNPDYINGNVADLVVMSNPAQISEFWVKWNA